MTIMPVTSKEYGLTTHLIRLTEIYPDEEDFPKNGRPSKYYIVIQSYYFVIHKSSYKTKDVLISSHYGGFKSDET